ncbi:MAG TPA: restriction endonuclease [Opitutaceae bacterium]|nr:restriction endonuclease [Opitutaceae bacterium]
MFALVGAATVVASFLILKSRLVAWKKVGLMLILAALLTAAYWHMARAPRQWREERATVVAINGPTAVTETDYYFRPDARGAEMVVTQSKSWARLSEANRYRAGPITLYFNPADPSEVVFEPREGWMRAPGRPGATRVRVTGVGTATLRVGSLLFPTTATTTGPHVADYAVGTTLPVWINPTSETEMSLRPRVTDSGPRYDLAALAGVLALAGVGALVLGSRSPGPDTPTNASVHSPQNPTSAYPPHLGAAAIAAPWTVELVRRRLDEIDWYQFEKFCAALLAADGFQVTRQGGAHPDGGVDLIVEQQGTRALIQCKHWRTWVVQERVVREMLGAMTHFGVKQGAIYTLKGWTKPAETFAAQHAITLVNGDELAQSASVQFDPARLAQLLEATEHHCPKCEALMVWRASSSFKPFWGCSRYPQCNGKLEHAGAR